MAAKKTTAKTTAAKKTITPKAAPKAVAAPKPVAKKATRESATAKRERAATLLDRLKQAIPDPQCELDHRDGWTLVIATILSAQSTDKMVNRVTPVLFARWPTPAALAAAPQEVVEEVVKSTGFFRNKAKAIRETSRVVAERFGGEVPRTLEELITLPGVARKTANVVLGTAFRITSGVTVDTHAGRVARRLALTTEEDPVKVEQDLCDLFPRDEWIDLGHRFVLHGRYHCLARKPKCGTCALNELCPAAEAPPDGTIEARAAAEWKTVASRGAE